MPSRLGELEHIIALSSNGRIPVFTSGFACPSRSCSASHSSLPIPGSSTTSPRTPAEQFPFWLTPSRFSPHPSHLARPPEPPHCPSLPRSTVGSTPAANQIVDPTPAP